LAIVMSVLRFMASVYPFGIFILVLIYTKYKTNKQKRRQHENEASERVCGPEL
jgi:hypothetical protein